MTFQERMTVALARSKQRQTQKQTASPVAARNQAKKPTTEQYRTATLERVLTKMKLMKETI